MKDRGAGLLMAFALTAGGVTSFAVGVPAGIVRATLDDGAPGVLHYVAADASLAAGRSEGVRFAGAPIVFQWRSLVPSLVPPAAVARVEMSATGFEADATLRYAPLSGSWQVSRAAFRIDFVRLPEPWRSGLFTPAGSATGVLAVLHFPALGAPPNTAEGSMTWHDAALHGPDGMGFGTVRIDLDMLSPESLVATITNEDGDFEATGEARLDADGDLSVDLVVRPRNATVSALAPPFSSLGAPEGDGGWRVSHVFTGFFASSGG